MSVFIHLMTTFIIVFLMNLGLLSTMALAHDEPNTDSWGYIRIDNKSNFPIYTKCYNQHGKGGKWRMTWDDHFRSCHGAYMRIDLYVYSSDTDTTAEKRTIRVWRNSLKCGDRGLYLKMRGRARESIGGRKKPYYVESVCR